MAILICIANLLTTYCKVERNGTADVATPIARRDHRKSKIGLRHRIKLIELYTVTKSEFWFSMIPPSYTRGNVPHLDPGRVNCKTRAADAWIFFRKFTKFRAQPPCGPDTPVPFWSTRQYTATNDHIRMHGNSWILNLVGLIPVTTCRKEGTSWYFLPLKMAPIHRSCSNATFQR
jgi:hypothetical protein